MDHMVAKVYCVRIHCHSRPGLPDLPSVMQRTFMPSTQLQILKQYFAIKLKNSATVFFFFLHHCGYSISSNVLCYSLVIEAIIWTLIVGSSRSTFSGLRITLKQLKNKNFISSLNIGSLPFSQYSPMNLLSQWHSNVLYL